MGLFSTPFESGPGPGEGARNPSGIDLAQEFATLAQWSCGKSFVDANPRYSDLIKGLPPGRATSMCLSESPGTISVTGEQPRVFGYPGSIELNMPAVTELADCARILVDLGYGGVEQEAPGVAHDIRNRSYGIRFSCIPQRNYPLIRLQISFYSSLREPLHLEVLSDILDRNVQNFYEALCENGTYELSVHVMRKHLGSVFASIDDRSRNGLAEGIAGLVSGMRRMRESDRDMQRAVKEFERRHPLGEGM